ncbi:Fe-S cluster assembly protein SufD [Phenylobacterium sp.]|uniref:Fe-S cluster assembly protein SufD n=1 Tax=Phenylobacterium sp. TaxID=1871053 RepID=UPI0026006C61|nr:Fe-S cluster assembly protein SufD [Phenylobacterium sp.]
MSVAAALKARNASALPSRRDEDWRWTDLRGLIRVLPEPSAPFNGIVVKGAFDRLADDHRVLVNGGVTRIEVAADRKAAVALRLIARGAGTHANQVIVSLAAGARLRLLETYESDGGSLAHTALTIALAEGAALERVVLAADHEDAVTISQAQVTLAPTADYGQTLLSSGARRQRLETRVAHPGGRASLRLDGVYVLAGKRHTDHTSVVTHQGLDGTTAQLTKGVVRDQARAVFQGKIIVSEGADHTDARMGHHALILSDRAEVDAKPELEIYADDVACAHGNTVGALDEDALFYACQRGIPEDEARAMLTEAFIGQVVDRIWFEDARKVARAWAAERLRA